MLLNLVRRNYYLFFYHILVNKIVYVTAHAVEINFCYFSVHITALSLQLQTCCSAGLNLKTPDYEDLQTWVTVCAVWILYHRLLYHKYALDVIREYTDTKRVNTVSYLR